jgi:hypothetical protein
MSGTLGERTQIQKDKRTMNADELKEELNFLEQFQRAWRMSVSEDVPSLSQCRTWYKLHNPLRMLKALSKTSAKAERVEASGRAFDSDFAARIFSSIANHFKTQEEQENIMTTEQKNPLPIVGNGKYTKPEPKQEPQKPLTPDQTQTSEVK